MRSCSSPPTIRRSSPARFWRQMEDIPRAEMRLITFEIATPLGVARRLGLWRSPQILDAHLAYTALLARREDWDFARQLAQVVLPPDLLGYLRAGARGRAALDEVASRWTDEDEFAGLNGAMLVLCIGRSPTSSHMCRQRKR